MAALLMSLTTPSGATGRSRTIVVDPTASTGPGVAATLASALDRARAGDVVRLAPGVHVGGVRTVRAGRPDAPIVVTGPRDAVLVGSGRTGRVVHVRHDHVVLHGFTIDGHDPGTAVDDAAGYRNTLVHVAPTRVGERVEGCRLLALRLLNAGREAVRLKLVRGCEVADNVIDGAGLRDFSLGGGGKNGEGVYVGTSPSQYDRNPGGVPDDSSEVHVHHNRIRTRASEGVNTKEGTHHVVVEHNEVLDQRDPDSAGINVQGDRSTVRSNVVRRASGAGIRLGQSTATPDGVPRGRHNTVVGNVMVSTGAGGLKVMSGPQALVCGNRVHGDVVARGPWASGLAATAECPDGTSGVRQAQVGPRSGAADVVPGS